MSPGVYSLKNIHLIHNYQLQRSKVDFRFIAMYNKIKQSCVRVYKIYNIVNIDIKAKERTIYLEDTYVRQKQ